MASRQFLFLNPNPNPNPNSYHSPNFNPSIRWKFSPLLLRIASSYPTIVCFREVDLPNSSEDTRITIPIPIPRSLSGHNYSPWAVELVEKCKVQVKPTTGGTGGSDGGNCGGGGGDGNGGGGDGEEGDGEGCGNTDDGDRDLFMLPLLTVALASVHMGYCVAVWIRDEDLDVRFMRTGLGLFCLLLLSALRLKWGAGIDAYILGLAASSGVMVWTGNRCFVKKESNSAGFVALLATSMSLIFSAALRDKV